LKYNAARMLLQHHICFCIYFSGEIALTILSILRYIKMFEDDSTALGNLKRDNAKRSHANLWLPFTPRFPGVL